MSLLVAGSFTLGASTSHFHRVHDPYGGAWGSW
jgi:hypothetical protein